MNNHSHDFVTVDMRGPKAALVMRARSDRVSVSVLVRSAVARDLGLAESGERSPAAPSASAPNGSTVKLSIRLHHLYRYRLGEAQLESGVGGVPTPRQGRRSGPITNITTAIATNRKNSALATGPALPARRQIHPGLRRQFPAGNGAVQRLQQFEWRAGFVQDAEFAGRHACVEATDQHHR
jgi:hypothetical protein